MTLNGQAERGHLGDGGLTAPARAAALAELAELAAGRSDLLAEFAGLEVGFHEGDLDEEHHILPAQLCIEAGADTSQSRYPTAGSSSMSAVAQPTTSRRSSWRRHGIPIGSAVSSISG